MGIITLKVVILKFLTQLQKLILLSPSRNVSHKKNTQQFQGRGEKIYSLISPPQWPLMYNTRREKKENNNKIKRHD